MWFLLKPHADVGYPLARSPKKEPYFSTQSSVINVLAIVYFEWRLVVEEIDHSAREAIQHKGHSTSIHSLKVVAFDLGKNNVYKVLRRL